MTAGPLLRIDAVSIRFGGIAALDDVTLTAAAGEIVGIIGPNGAGKTTLFNCIAGSLKPSHGRIDFEGTRIERMAAHRRARLGIARTFQHGGLFDGLTVSENILAGADYRSRGSRTGRIAKVGEMIEAFALTAWMHSPPSEIPAAARKRAEMARAVVGGPRLLLLDEPAAGLLPAETAAIGETIRMLRANLGITILIVEHQMPLIMTLCDRLVVLDFGRLVAEGTPASVRTDPRVKGVYFGNAA